MNASKKIHSSKMLDTVERSMPNNEANRANIIAIRYKSEFMGDSFKIHREFIAPC
jgi:hypothetical protein